MHCGYVTKVKDLRKHSNADRLLVGTCFGNQVIIGSDITEEILGVYFPSDLQLSVDFCVANNLLRKKDSMGNNIGGFLDENKRNIKPLKLRGEISDGLFLPINCLNDFTDISKLRVGDTIDILDGVLICEKYVPLTKEQRKSNGVNKVKKEKKKTSYPLFKEHIDTAQLAYNMHYFKAGDLCYITLKMHGTSQRTANTIQEKRTYKKGLKKLLRKISKKPLFDVSREWSLITGTRRTVLENFDGGFYGDNNFRKKYHDFFDGKLLKGEAIYYEVVGFQSTGTPIMGTVSNQKTQDKEFIKKYGEETVYSYGCEKGENDIYVYRMNFTDEFGTVIEYPWSLVKLRAEQMGVKVVEEFDKFIFTTQEDLMERVHKYCDGTDPIGKTHIREGVVVRVDNSSTFKAFKHKNFHFKLLEGIIKDAGIADLEEQESSV